MENRIVNIFMDEIKNIRFENVEELFNKREYIRKKYEMLSQDFQQMYKWYFFYQLCIVKKFELKRVLWYYINSNGEDMDLNIGVLTEYNKFKKEQNKLKNINEDSDIC